MNRLVAATAATFAAVTSFFSSDSEAAPPFVTRPMTLPRHDFAGDVGLGVGHLQRGPFSFTGAGMNLEGAFGITQSVELGLRTGIRFGDDGRFTRADAYGRTLWTETYGTGFDRMANPEARVRWSFFSGNVVEVGLDWRLYLPFENATRVGGMFGLPIHFHVGNFMRIDTGPYLPVLFTDPSNVALTVPGYFWFQVSDSVWLGPMVSARLLLAPDDGRDRTSFLGGFGLGVQLHRAVDLKTMVLFPTLGDEAAGRNWGGGIGLQFRIE